MKMRIKPEPYGNQPPQAMRKQRAQIDVHVELYYEQLGLGRTK